MNNLHRYFIIAFLACSYTLCAQESSDLPNSEKEIIKNFQANLAEANILPIKVEAVSIDTNRAFIRQYKLTTQPVELEYPAPKMKPLAVQQEENPTAKPFYLKAGYGLPNNPFVEAGYTLASDDYKVTLHGLYESIEDSKLEWLRFSDLATSLSGYYGLTDNVNIFGDFSYAREKYGIRPIDNSSSTTITYTIPILRAGIQNSSSTRADIDYVFHYQFRPLKTEFIKENNHQAYAQLKKYIGESKKQAVSFHASAEFNSVPLESAINNELFILGLEGQHSDDRWRLNGGLDVGLDGDQTILLPQLEISALLSQSIQPYLGVRSNAQLTTMYHLSRLVPYTFFFPATTNFSREAFLGARGRHAFVKYDAFVGLAWSENDALFLPRSSGFPVIYDDLRTWTIAANVDADVMDNLTVGTNIAYYNYTAETRQAAYQRPTFIGEIHGQYSGLLSQKLQLKLSVETISGIRSKEDDFISSPVIVLKPQWNVDFLASYEIYKSVDVFLQVNNILDNKNPRYIRYPQIGINPQLGVKLRL